MVDMPPRRVRIPRDGSLRPAAGRQQPPVARGDARLRGRVRAGAVCPCEGALARGGGFDSS